jgi:hypothetical protein
MIFVYFNFWTGLTGFSGLFFLDHFPEESDPTQSAFSGKKQYISVFIL